MSSLQSMRKKCRFLEEKEKWKELSEACDQMGRMLSEKGKFKEALEFHTKDKQVCEMMQDVPGQAQAHRMMGEVLADLAKYKEALEQQKQYLAMSRQLQDAVMEQRALATLGRTYMYIAETDKDVYSRALKYFTKCLQAVSRISKNDIDTRERASMTGRAEENMGVVSWHLGKRGESENHLARSESMYRDNKLWEDLYRLTDSIVSLLLVSATPSDLSAALKYSETSIEAAHKVHTSARQKQCLVGALYTKSKVLLLREEWEDARDSLIRARGYGVETTVSPVITNNLKMLVTVVRCREQIMAGVGEGLMSHTAYEGIADTLCKFAGDPGERVKVLELAVKYYKLAYSRADNEGSMASLPALNISIAETYKDMGDYDQALVFFQKQLDLERGNYKELCSTLSNIASVRESLKSSYQQVLQPLLEWEESAKMINSVSQQVMALQEVVRVQELDGREGEARDTREKIINLGGSLDVEEPNSQGSGVSDISDNFPEVDLDMLEAPTIRAGEARRTPALFKNRNAKGEYPLHIKLQKSDQESEVLSMIERGHPLEVEDNAGWTPLGEAVGNKYISYVKLLVKAGAKLNHRNEKGETPLMAACAQGWLDGIEFLMDRGAKMDLKNKKGESSMAFLRDHVKEGKKGKCADYKLPGVMDRLESALARMEAEYNRLGLSVDYSLPADSDSMGLEEEEGDNELDNTLRSTYRQESGAMVTSTQRPGGQARRQVSRSPSPVQRRRSISPQTISKSRRLSPLSRSPSPLAQSRRSYSHSRSPSPTTTRPISPVATQAYKNAIAGVRNSSTKTVLQPVLQVGRRNTVSQVDVEMGDWLEIDMGSDKKRKRPTEDPFSDTKKAKSLSNRRENLSPTPSISIDLTNSPALKPPQKMSTNRLSKTKKTHQPKIYHSLPPTRPASPSLPHPTSSSTLPFIVPDMAPIKYSSLPTTRVKVRVAGEVFLIPVPQPDTTVRWLASEASARYYRQVGSEPVIRLTTGDGAGLDPGDLVTHVVQGSEALIAVVTSWNCKPAEERYRDTCKDMGTPCFRNICDRLSLMATTNTLSINIPLKKQQAEPIFHCLKSNMGLRELNVSRCKLSDPSMTLLVSLLPTLPYLSTLDLSQNILSLQSLQLLSSLQLPSLSRLSLSGNPLGDLSLPSLTSLLSVGPIISLKLSRCLLTKSVFQSGRPDFSVAMKKSKLKTLDVSHNNFGEIGVEILLKCLPPTLSSLDMTACIISTSSSNFGNHLSSFTSLGNPDCDLTSLNLSSLCLTDSTLTSTLSCLSHCGRLSSLSISHNPITASGLVSLITSLVENSVPLTTLDCAQLKSVSSSFWSDKTVLPELEDRLESLLSSNCSRLEYLALPDHPDMVACLRKVWDKAWGSRSRHNRDGLGNFVLCVG